MDSPLFVQFQFQVVSLLHQLFIMLEKKEIIDSSTDFSQTNKILKNTHFTFSRSAKVEEFITLAKFSGQVCLEPPDFARNKSAQSFQM